LFENGLINDTHRNQSQAVRLPDPDLLKLSLIYRASHNQTTARASLPITAARTTNSYTQRMAGACRRRV
jgi:hypothetical protein